MNILSVRSDGMHTSPSAAILEGITRDSVITLAKDDGYMVIEEPMVWGQLYIADDVFACGNAAEVTPVSKIVTRTIGAGQMGSITRELQQEFFKQYMVKGNLQRNGLILYRCLP